MGKKILVVDDEPKIVRMVQSFLEKEGFSVVTAADGQEALELFRQVKPDLVVLDWLLPQINGLDVCREIRQNSSVPVIMLTAKSEEIDKLLGLEIGADDYLTKPFSLRELTARIRVILRRVDPESSNRQELITIGELTIDNSCHQVRLKGREITLTPTEFKLLSVIARSPGRVFSRLQLLDTTIGESYEGYERSIDTHISNLRKKVEPDPANPVYILTVFAIGYKMGTGGEPE